MELFKFRVREDPRRKERLVRIRRSIEAGLRFEEDAMSRPLNASTLKRIYNIESLWVADDGEVRKLGSANYGRELAVFQEMAEKYAGLKSVRVQRGSEKYHMVRRGGKVYLFSTTLELSNTDVFMILNDIERALEQKKIFLSSDTNNTEDDG